MPKEVNMFEMPDGKTIDDYPPDTIFVHDEEYPKRDPVTLRLIWGPPDREYPKRDPVTGELIFAPPDEKI